MEEGGQHWQQQSQVSQAKDNDNLHKITTTGVERTLGTGGLGQRGGGGDTHVTNGISSSNGLSLGSHKYAQRHYTSI